MILISLFIGALTTYFKELDPSNPPYLVARCLLWVLIGHHLLWVLVGLHLLWVMVGQHLLWVLVGHVLLWVLVDHFSLKKNTTAVISFTSGSRKDLYLALGIGK